MELASNVANRVSKAFGFKGWTLPRWMRWGFLALLAYMLLQLLVAGFEVHRTPLYTSFVLLGLLGLALLAGVMFREPRAFCQSFCPASLLLSVYSRLSRVGSWYSASIAYLYIPYCDAFQPEHSLQDIGFRVVAKFLP